MTDIFVSNYDKYPIVSAYIDDKLEFISVVRNSVLDDVYLCRVENVRIFIFAVIPRAIFFLNRAKIFCI